MEKKVSVIVPVYNSERFLSESIQSVISQNYKNLEIIAVNDGSTDNSLEILNRFKDKIIIIHQDNQGLANSLTTGIKKSTGNWIKWFSPDDVMYPNCIEELINHCTDNTIVYSNWDIIDENSNLIRTFTESNYNLLNQFDFTVRLLDGQQINVNTTLIPTRLFSKCKIRNLENQVAIDYDFFLNAALNFSTNFFLIKKPLIQYRIHTNQLSHKNIKSTLSIINDLKKEYLEKLDDKTRKKYIKGLIEYNKEKSIIQKTLDSGLKLISKLPNRLSDKILVYYLNKLRSSR